MNSPIFRLVSMVRICFVVTMWRPDQIGNWFRAWHVVLRRMHVPANASIKSSSICHWNSCINQRIPTDVSAWVFGENSIAPLTELLKKYFFLISHFNCRATNRIQSVWYKLVGNGNIKGLCTYPCATWRKTYGNSCTNSNRTMFEYLVSSLQLVYRSQSRTTRSKSSLRCDKGERTESTDVRWIGRYTAIDHKR